MNFEQKWVKGLIQFISIQVAFTIKIDEFYSGIVLVHVCKFVTGQSNSGMQNLISKKFSQAYSEP